jgi:hypothetical protein
METDQIVEPHWAPGYPLVSQPHFVEERTLLSARPVVPLEQVKTRERSRRGLLLTSAIALSLLLGACTALAIVYVQQRRSTQTAATRSQSDATQQNASEQVTAPSAPVEEATAVEKGTASSGAGARRGASNTTPDQDKRAVVVNTSNTENRRIATVPSAKTSRQNEVPVVDAGPAESGARRSDQEMRRYERREARRVWREEIRQRRVNSGDDLFRIREIFEGRRRPE